MSGQGIGNDGVGGAGKSPGGGNGGGKRGETVYSDRFVPSRSASAGLQGFNLLDSTHPLASTSHPSSEREVSEPISPLLSSVTPAHPSRVRVVALSRFDARRGNSAPEER